LRGRDVGRLVLAVPVAAPDAVRMLSAESDHVVALVVPEDFVAVGRWYDDFAQLGDDDVRDALRTISG
jgi:predicted phosphoribosyltransferase